MYAIVSYWDGKEREAELVMIESPQKNGHLTIINALRLSGRRVSYKAYRKDEEAVRFLQAIRGA